MQKLVIIFALKSILYQCFLIRESTTFTFLSKHVHPFFPRLLHYAILTHFILVFALANFALRQNFDTHLFIVTFRVDAAITQNCLLRFARRLWVELSILLTALYDVCTFAAMVPISEIAHFPAIVRGAHDKTFAETVVAIRVASFGLKGLQRFQVWQPRLSSHSKRYVKAIPGGYNTTLDNILDDGVKGDVKFLDDALWGLSALISSAQSDPCPDQVTVSTSSFGHFMDSTRADTDLILNTPIFCVSYIHMDYQSDKLDKMRPDDWQAVNKFARYMAGTCSGKRYYMLWFDGVIRARKQGRRDILKETWMYYGLLPYALFHTIAVRTDNQESNKRLWPAMERAIASFVGKLYISTDEDGFSAENGRTGVSASTALRLAGLWPAIYEGHLETFHKEDAQVLRGLLARFAVGDFALTERSSARQRSVSRSPAAKAVRVDETMIRRLSAEILWLIAHQHGANFGLDEMEGFTLGDPRNVNGPFIDPIIDAIRGGVRGIPRCEELCVSQYDSSLLLTYFMVGVSRDGTSRGSIGDKIQIGCGIRKWGTWKAQPLPFLIEVQKGSGSNSILSVRSCRPELVPMDTPFRDINAQLREIYGEWGVVERDRA